MQLLIVYVVLVIVGELLAAAAGYYIERTVPAASLPVFLAMFFSVLVIAWLLAIRITRPKQSGS